MNEKIVIKKVVSLTLVFSFLVMSFTGVMLYIAPKGKIAYWANWKLLGLTKDQFADIHMTSMILFMVIVVWHVYYNWKSLLYYICDSAKKIKLLKTELLIALAVNVFFVAGTLIGVQPLQFVIDTNNDIKSYWEKMYGSPPFGHAEESSLKSLSRSIGIDVAQAILLLKEKNIAIDADSQTLQEIATKNATTPQVIYDIIKVREKLGGSGVEFLGKRTLQELSGMQKIHLEKSLLFLKDRGFDATSQTKMREAAEAIGLTPYQLFEKLKVL
jgi:hypothetical protein